MNLFRTILFVLARCCTIVVVVCLVTQVARAQTNEAPFVIPALHEWKGSTGQFEWKQNVKLIVDPKYKEQLLPVAQLLAEDWSIAAGAPQPAVGAGKATGGAVFLPSIIGIPPYMQRVTGCILTKASSLKQRTKPVLSGPHARYCNY